MRKRSLPILLVLTCVAALTSCGQEETSVTTGIGSLIFKPDTFYVAIPKEMGQFIGNQVSELAHPVQDTYFSCPLPENVQVLDQKDLKDAHWVEENCKAIITEPVDRDATIQGLSTLYKTLNENNDTRSKPYFMASSMLGGISYLTHQSFEFVFKLGQWYPKADKIARKSGKVGFTIAGVLAVIGIVEKTTQLLQDRKNLRVLAWGIALGKASSDEIVVIPAKNEEEVIKVLSIFK